ncbi:MAG: immunity 52 family protein [Rhodobacteraceae bacterium]|nr:immunity 52 family protein [Paracoccaceae bacterium]
MIKLMVQHERDFRAKYPGVSLSASNGILLANAEGEEKWAAKGSVAIAINPGPGEIRLDIGRLQVAQERAAELVWSSLKALTADAKITLAQTNIMQAVGRERRLYSLRCGVFPHREFLGWMGYVDQPVDESQVPDAVRVERHGRGTMIMATEDVDLFNARSVEQMNRVEIRLAELGLLPAITSSL